MVSTKLSAALINASARVILGMVRYLCLKKKCFSSSDVFGISDVDLVVSAVFLCIVYVLSCGPMWCPCFLDCRCDVHFHFASQWCKWVCIVVVLAT
jgi:hypothetical protein